MNGEAVINLVIEEEGKEFMVTCDQFPLLALLVPDCEKSTLEERVLPVLERMIHSHVDERVSLRLVDTFQTGHDDLVAPHVIAKKEFARVA